MDEVQYGQTVAAEQEWLEEQQKLKEQELTQEDEE